MRTCGTLDNTPDLRGHISSNRLELEPGAGVAFKAGVVEITPSGKILHHKITNARTGGLGPVTDAGEATVPVSARPSLP